MDLVVQVPHSPHAGETLAGTHFSMIPGGKGANQALAASRSGAETHMVGCVGQDAFGQVLLDSLAHGGVRTDAVHKLRNISTGIASILVEKNGDNRIVIVPGANGRLSPALLSTEWKTVNEAALVVLQHEIPMETVHACISECATSGIAVLINPAPYYPIPEQLFKSIRYLVMNESEATALTGIKVTGIDSAWEAARFIANKGCRSVIVTLGKAGAILTNGSNEIYQPAFEVNVVDTTAAGDTFVGAFAACQLEGRTIGESLTYASAAAALSVTRLGAQASIPVRSEVLDFLQSRSCYFSADGGK